MALIAKVYRSQLYYELCSRNYRTKANGTQDPVAAAVSASLARVSSDMKFICDKACRHLTEEERQRLIIENPTPYTSENQKRIAA